ncbi:hypothetical protein N7449_012355 [Penicillium cf. viridicatum]|uniref:Uncharacterized protein n=1 Tax=Penicillium cf. viridicatum TaxID=2972119 RepID=A0A9W9IQ61_9EURO|nr:hypothetical protein N7449_012355 [Penicillium cf. viridicatum]
MKSVILASTLASVAAVQAYTAAEQSNVQASLIFDPKTVAGKTVDYIIAGGGVIACQLARCLHLLYDVQGAWWAIKACCLWDCDYLCSPT